MVALVEKYRPEQPPSDPGKLGDFLRDELQRIAEHMAGRDEVVCGRDAFVSAGTATVTFDREQPDTLYQVVIGPTRDENVWVTGHAETGFTLNSDNTSSTQTVQWALFRDRDSD